MPILVVTCSGPNTPVVVDGEPVCPDFLFGAAKTPMKGGLRNPIQVKALDGSNVIATALVFGRRTTATPEARFLVPDANEEYTIEWAQCPNARATEATQAGKTAPAAKYACGDAKPYTTTKLTTKRGDPSTFRTPFAPPSDPACWETEPAPAPAAP